MHKSNLGSSLERLVDAAKAAREDAYTVYFGFPVGAAVLTEDGDVYTGCNVEFKPTNCGLHAEPRALLKTLEDGVHATDIGAIAVCCDIDDPQLPCGPCRNQIASVNYDMWVIASNTDGEVKKRTIKQILPNAYTG